MGGKMWRIHRIFLTVLVVIMALYVVSRNWSISAFTPPQADQMYFAKDPGTEDQFIFVKLNADGTMLLMRSETDNKTYYADTATIYAIKGHYMKPIVGHLYLSDGTIPLPFLGEPGTVALNAELECTYSGANYAANETKVGEKNHSMIYYSDDVFYAGSTPLKRIREWPNEMLDWAEGVASIQDVL